MCSVRAAVCAAAALALCLGACREPAAPQTGSPPLAAGWFTDGTAAAGLDFLHANGMSGQFAEPEILGSGVALFDYDNDGDLDLYLVQGGPAARDRLYRNDLATPPQPRTVRLADVTEASGIGAWPYGMGVAAGDFDNDGWVDLYLTRLGPNVLLRNTGDGRFVDMSRQSGTDDPSWSSSASFVDVDRDGWLDLFVANYLAYRPDADVACATAAGQPDYCGPSVYPPGRNRLYLNQRNGTFRDVTASAFVEGPGGQALGVASADFDADGWMDIFVASDRAEHALWMNQRDGTFANAAPLAGTALATDGRAGAGRGVDVADVDEDGDEDVLVTHDRWEGASLYLNDGAARFEDVGTRSGLRQATTASAGFGAGLRDFDHDGRVDLFVVNGAVTRIETIAAAAFPYGQRKQLFRNIGRAEFDEMTASALRALGASEVGRGAAFGDVDNDGDVDVVAANNSGPARLLINNASSPNHWVGIQLARRGNRSILGARVGVVRLDGSTVWRRARADGSYASASDPRVAVGLGASPHVASVRVVWPDGTSEQWHTIAADRWTTLVEGTGR